MNKPTPIEIVRQEYQPTKAEAEEVIVLRKTDGSAPTAQELAHAIVQPVKITYLGKPKSSLSRR